MDKLEFVTKLEGYFGKTLESHIAVMYSGAVGRFSDLQRRWLFDRLVEVQRYFPKIVEINDTARELKFFTSAKSEHITHQWTPTNCQYCHGEGRVSVYDSGAILPHSSLEGVMYRSANRANYAYEQVARCCCPAGEAPNLNKRIGRIHWRQEEHDTPNKSALEPVEVE